MDFVDQIFKVLKSGNAKDSPEIRTLLATIQQVKPEMFDTAIKIVENWPSPPSLKDRLPSANALVGGGFGIAAIASVPWLSGVMKWLEANYPLTTSGISNPMLLLGIIGSLGALAGAGYSVFANRGLVLKHAYSGRFFADLAGADR